MTDEKKPDNIVKKVFDRPDTQSGRVSPIFTYYKNLRKAKKELARAKVPDPEGLRRFPAAVDFGLSCIKVIQLAQDAQGQVEVVLMDEESCAVESSGDRYFKTKKALDNILSRNSLGTSVVVGLQAKETQSYSFSFPPMSEEELREAVRWKVRQLKPFNLEEEKVHYAVLRWERPDAQRSPVLQQRVTVVCVSTDSISQKTSILDAAGIKPLAVCVSALGLANARRFRAASRIPDEVVLWLDLGGEESVFVVEKNGVTLFMRNLTVTGNLLTRQVAQACHVTEAEAETLKQKHGLEYWTPELQANVLSQSEKQADPSAAVCYALVSTLENLVVDIEYSFKYFSYQVTQSQIPKFDRVILAGGCSNLKRIENFLSDRLAVPVEKVNPFSSVHVPETIRNTRKNFEVDGPVFAPGVGLALTPLLDKDSVIDLLVGQKKKTGGHRIGELRLTPKRVAVLATGTAALLLVPLTVERFHVKKIATETSRQVKAAREELTRRQSSQMELAEEEKKLLGQKTLLQDRLSLLLRNSADHRSFSRVLTTLASLLPDEIWVTKLSYAEKKLTLVGATAKNELIVVFLENLKKPEEFSDVAFDHAERDPNSSVFSFQIMMNVK